MNDQMITESVIIAAFLLVAVAFLLFVQSGGFLTVAINRAAEEGNVVFGMTEQDVIIAWGRPCRAERQGIQLLNVAELATSVWVYENPHRIVYFSEDGIVIWVES